MSRKFLIPFILLPLTLLIALIFIYRPLIFLNRASTSTTPITQNSYLFASPVTAKADGQQSIRVTVFILDGQGLGVANQTVTLSLPAPISQKPIQPQTDQYGKAIFDLSSSSIGKFQISASVNNDTLPQSLTIVFY